MYQPLKGHHQAKILVIKCTRIHIHFFNGIEISVYNPCLHVAGQHELIIKIV
jgi:hypothetical protein